MYKSSTPLTQLSRDVTCNLSACQTMLKSTYGTIPKIIMRHNHFHKRAKLSELIPAIVVHGGISNDFETHAPSKMTSLVAAVNHGYTILKDTDNPVEAVEAAMVFMEDSIDFNCGYGSMLNSDGNVEMDCCLMYGDALRSGAVGCLADVKNPIKVARAVMEHTPHVLLCCEGAKEFAQKHHFDILKPGALVTDRSKLILNERSGGAVGNAGVVAIDSKGHLAACTSSGGTVGRHPGRCSECCRLGCGVYADDKIGAIAVTGDGENLLKCLLGFATLKGVASGLSLIEAMDKHIRRFHSMSGKPAGAIGFDRLGSVAIHFTAPVMPWGYRSPSEYIYGSTLKELPRKYRNYASD